MKYQIGSKLEMSAGTYHIKFVEMADKQLEMVVEKLEKTLTGTVIDFKDAVDTSSMHPNDTVVRVEGDKDYILIDEYSYLTVKVIL